MVNGLTEGRPNLSMAMGRLAEPYTVYRNREGLAELEKAWPNMRGLGRTSGVLAELSPKGPKYTGRGT